MKPTFQSHISRTLVIVQYHDVVTFALTGRGSEKAFDLVMASGHGSGIVDSEVEEKMTIELAANRNSEREEAVARNFLANRCEESFADLFAILTPQLVAFFRARSCELDLAEDLAQEVMFTVYRKAEQVRDRGLFRAWVFKIARNTLCGHYAKKTREVVTVDLAGAAAGLTNTDQRVAAPAFEFFHWMAFLDSREREVMRLRFVEEWEYHEIAASQAIPIGTVQWRVFNAKKKLAPHLRTAEPNLTRRAA